MYGDKENPGVIPLAIQDLFKCISRQGDRQFILKVSFMEIYNEKIIDLLSDDQQDQPIKIKEDIRKGVFVSGLKEVLVISPEQIFSLIESGNYRRHVSHTRMNVQSSRSHTILRFEIESIRANDRNSPIRWSALNLVDLAGSEKQKDSKCEGQRLKEGGYINKSLHTLGKVIAKLSSDQSNRGHIPFRESKLTRILEPSLGSSSRTSVICTVTPASIHIDETIATLKFGSRAKRISNKAAVNELIQENMSKSQLERELQSALNEKNQYLAETFSLRSFNELVESEIEEHLKTIESLKVNNINLEEKNQNFIQQITSLEEENKNIYEEKLFIEQENEKILTNIKEKEGKLSHFSETISIQCTRIQELEQTLLEQNQENDSLKQQIIDFQNNQLQQDKIIESQKQSLIQANSRIEQKDYENIQSKSKIDDLMNQIEDLLQQQHQNKEIADRDLLQLSENLNKQTHILDQLKEENDSLKKLLSTETEKLNNYEIQFQSELNEKATLILQINNLENSLKHLQECNLALQVEKENIDKELSQEKEQFLSLNEFIQNIPEHINSTIEHVNFMYNTNLSQINKIEDKISILLKQFSRIYTNYMQQKSILSALQNQLSISEETYSQQIQVFNEEKLHLNQKLDTLAIEHKQEINRIFEENDIKISQLNNSHNNILKELESNYQNNIKAIEMNYTTVIQDLEDKHKAEQNEILQTQIITKNNYNKHTQDLLNEIQQYKTNITKLEENLKLQLEKTNYLTQELENSNSLIKKLEEETILLENINSVHLCELEMEHDLEITHINGIIEKNEAQFKSILNNKKTKILDLKAKSKDLQNEKIALLQKIDLLEQNLNHNMNQREIETQEMSNKIDALIAAADDAMAKKENAFEDAQQQLIFKYENSINLLKESNEKVVKELKEKLDQSGMTLNAKREQFFQEIMNLKYERDEQMSISERRHNEVIDEINLLHSKEIESLKQQIFNRDQNISPLLQRNFEKISLESDSLNGSFTIQLGELDRHTEELQDKIQFLKQKHLRKIEQIQVQHNEQIQSLQEKYQYLLQQQLETSENTLTEIKSGTLQKIESLKDEVESLKIVNSTLSEEKETLLTLNSSLREELQHLKVVQENSRRMSTSNSYFNETPNIFNDQAPERLSLTLNDTQPEIQIRELQKKLKLKSNNLSQLEHMYKSLKDSEKQFEHTIESMKKENTKANQKIIKLESMIESFNAIVKEKDDQINQLSLSLQRIEESRLNAHKKIQELESSLDKQSLEHQDRKSENMKFKDVIESLKDEIEGIREHAINQERALQREIRELKSHNRSIEEESIKISTQLKDAESTIIQLKSEFDQSKENCISLMKKLEEAADDHENELSFYTNRNQLLTAENESLKRSVRRLQNAQLIASFQSTIDTQSSRKRKRVFEDDDNLLQNITNNSNNNKNEPLSTRDTFVIPKMKHVNPNSENEEPQSFLKNVQPTSILKKNEQIATNLNTDLKASEKSNEFEKPALRVEKDRIRQPFGILK